MANVGALDQVRTFLREHPDVHTQQMISCGTAACVAGWTVALDAGVQYGQNVDLVLERRFWADPRRVPTQARDLLGLEPVEAWWLFFGTLRESEPEEAALDLIDAIIAREKHDLTDEQRALLDRYGLPTEPSGDAS